MPPNKLDSLKHGILTERAEIVASDWLLDRVPHLFGGKRPEYLRWKDQFGAMIDVDPCAILLVGSASVGFSLNPKKKFKPFDGESDVDVAVISDFYFDLGWRHLRMLGPQLYKLPPDVRRAVERHVENYVYWGTIAADLLLAYLPYGAAWVKALSTMAGVDPTAGRSIKLRIYRDFEMLRAYHTANLRKLKTDLLSA